MKFTPEGAPIPGGIPTSNLDPDARYRNTSLHSGYVIRAVYPGDSDNVTGFLEYIVVINHNEYYGVLDMTLGGGIFNNHTRIRKGAENIDVQSGQPDADFDERKDGEQVWCLFIGGDEDQPIIVGSKNHVRIGEVNTEYTNPTKDLGVYERYEFNGLEKVIDKDGNLTLTLKGAKTLPAVGNQFKSKDPTLDDYKGTFYKIHNNGTIELDLKLKTNILIDPVNDIITIKNGDGTIFTINGADDYISLKANTGLEYKLEGDGDKFSFTTVGGTKMILDGDGDIATVETNAGGRMKITGGKVGIGGPTAELLQQISDQLQRLITLTGTNMTAETHTGNLGYPSSPPLNAASYATVSGQLTGIKALVDGIKGGI